MSSIPILTVLFLSNLLFLWIKISLCIEQHFRKKPSNNIGQERLICIIAHTQTQAQSEKTSFFTLKFVKIFRTLEGWETMSKSFWKFVSFWSKIIIQITV